MRFPVGLTQHQIPDVINRLLAITGAQPWVKRFEWLDRELRDNQQMDDWLCERFRLEIGLARAVQQRELQTAGGYRLDQPGRYEVVAFAAGVSAIYERISAAGQRRLRGQLLDGLKSDKGLLPLQYEVSTAIQLIQTGFELTCHDLESGGGFDFLAERDGLAVEVECKLFSSDVGRRIHRRATAKLLGRLRAMLLRTVDQLHTGLLLRITFAVRLSSADAQHDKVANLVERCVLSNQTVADYECSVSLLGFDATSAPFSTISSGQVDTKLVRESVKSLTGNRNPALAILGSPLGGVLIVLFESAKADDVIGGIRQQLSKAANEQFTGTRPGVLYAGLHELVDMQIRELVTADSTGRSTAPPLQRMTSDLLQAPKRAHVHSVIYQGTPTLYREGGSVGVRGVSYLMRNEFHPLALDPRFTMFGSLPRIPLVVP